MRYALALLLVACGRGPERLTTMSFETAGESAGASAGGGAAGGSAGGLAPSEADGTLGAWAIDRPLPVARANHCSAAFGDWLLVAGGNYKPAGATDFVSNDDVLAARVGGDGALGEWRVVGRLPAAGTDCVLAVSGKTLVLLGALFTDSTLNGRVWTATLADDASLGAWSEVGALPYGRRALGAGALFDGAKLWLTDSRLSSEGAPEAILASASLGTTVSAWAPTVYAMSFRGRPLGAFGREAAFIIGGYGDGNATLAEVTAIPLGGGAPVPATALPEARTFGAAAAAGDWVFVTGGRTQLFGVLPVAVTYSAKATGAALGEWSAQLPLPEVRSNHTATVARDWLYVVGGGAGAGGLDTVFRARVKHPAPVQ